MQTQNDLYRLNLKVMEDKLGFDAGAKVNLQHCQWKNFNICKRKQAEIAKGCIWILESVRKVRWWWRVNRASGD